MAKDQYDCGIVDTIETIFGKHNLTSDADGEEMLTVSRKEVQRLFDSCNRHKRKRLLDGDSIDYFDGEINILTILFGSKCLSNNDANEVNFASKEPKPAEPEEPTCTDTCTDDCPSQSRNLSQETANCDKCNDLRLHIAAMAMQGILGNADRMKSYEQIAVSEPYDNLSAVVARNAMRYANALIAECSKDTIAG